MTKDLEPVTIGFVGFGEAAYHFAKGLRGAGADRMFAYDIHSSTAGPGERICKRASETRTALVDSPSGLASECHVVISVVTASSALEAARQNRPFLTARHIYADFNSVSPALKQAIAQEIASGPARFVEGAIMAPVPSKGHRVPILLNGPAASGLAQALARYGMNLSCLAGEIGMAAAVKMCRSIVVKGLEALVVECAMAAGQYGATELVMASLQESFPGVACKEMAEYMVGRVFEHGERRAREMEEVAATLRAAGIEPIMAEAAGRVQDWRARLGRVSNPTAADPADPQAMLAALAAGER